MKSLSDLIAPATPVRRLLEKDVQKQCVDWARARGYWARKFSSQSQRSVPDYLFARRLVANEDAAVVRTLKFAVEFKRHGQMATPAQQDEIQAMEQAGWRVYVCWDLRQFQSYVIAQELDLGMCKGTAWSHVAA
ncbi:MAG: hypothetical protein KGL39_07070 [Patescibacteria group bacterium]|nr:hypothetical protein [Patescibacteria group bacterium]